MTLGTSTGCFPLAVWFAISIGGAHAKNVTTKITVQGKSGKFTVYDAAKGEAKGITVTMDALKEVDASNEEVGTAGNTKHSINTFAAQDFTIAPATSVSLSSSVRATKISFDSPISTIGKIHVDTYIMENSGVVGSAGETWAVEQGDAKWNIELSQWKWCGGEVSCKKGQTDQIGAFVDVDISVTGLGNANKTATKSISLGGNLTLELSSNVLVDGSLQSMPTGYPMVTLKGSSTVMTFRFPKFSTTALYDPLIQGFGKTDSSQAVSDTTTQPYVSATVDAAFSLSAISPAICVFSVLASIAPLFV